MTDETDTDASAAPLRRLVGMLDEDAAERARERTEKWREMFNEEIPTDD